MVPGVELRGAVPIGVSLGMSLEEAFLLSYLGSLLPAVPLILLIRPLVSALARSRHGQRLGQWLVRRSLRRSRHISRYHALGLFFFVSFPIPGTGVWTGAMIAGLLRMPLKSALASIAAGNLVAGAIVTFITHQLG